MAARVNTRFVFLLSSVLILLVGGVAAYWFMFVRHDPEELIRRGDEHMAATEYDQAIESYGRALRHRPDDVALREMYLNALEVAPVSSNLIAERNFQQIVESRRVISALQRNNDAALEQYYQLLWNLTRDGLFSNARLHQIADRRLTDEPNNVIARRYRGMAQARRLSADRTRDEQLQALEDLQFALEHQPDDAEVIRHLIFWNIFEANRLDRPGGNREEAAAVREEAVTLAEQMLEVDPDNRHRQLIYVQTMTNPVIDETDRARPVLDALEAQLLEDPQPRHILLDTVNLLQQTDRTLVMDEASGRELSSGLLRAHHLLNTAAEAHPDEAVYQLALGQTLIPMRREDEALERFRKTRTMASEAPAVRYLRWRRAGVQASYREADLLIAELSTMEEGEQRQAMRRQVEQILDQVRERQPDATELRMLDGKLAILDREFGKAAIALDQVSQQSNHRNPDALRLAAGAYRQLGDWGAAAERLEALARLRPDRLETHMELVNIHISGGMLDQAEQRLAVVLELAPDHPETQRLQARLLARQGDVEEATRLYENLDVYNNQQLALELVQLYAASGRSADAVAVLERRLENAPDDLRAIQMLFTLGGDQVDVAAVLDRAQAAGLASQTVEQLRRLQAGEQISVDEVIAAQEDPLQRALLRAELARRQNDHEAARAAMQEAEQIDRDNPRVVTMLFEMAMQDEDWEQAERYARRAQSQNLDLAEGAFFHGRLAVARGDLRTGISHLRQGLSARPVYSDGWMYLGEALRRNQDLEAAIDAYQNAIEQRPNNVNALRGLAATLSVRGEHAEALEHLRNAVRHRSRDMQLLEQYLRYEQQHGNREQAISLRQQLAEAAPDNHANRRHLATLLAQAGQAEEARDVAEHLLADVGVNRNNVGTLAEVYRLSGDPGRGQHIIRRYIENRGDEREMEDYILLARYNLSIEDGSGAAQAYQQAIEIDESENRAATREFAYLLYQRGMHEQAAPLLEQLHEARPDDAEIALALAEARIQLDRVDEARAILDRVPESPERRTLQAIIARLGGDLEQARTHIDRAIAQSRASGNVQPLFYVERARIHLLAGNQQSAAESDLNEALRIAPNHLNARELQVQVLMGRGDTNSAKQALRTLLTHHPQALRARLLLLDLYRNDNELRAAQNLLEESQAMYPDDANWPRLLADLATRAGQYDAARRHWRQAVTLAPDPVNVNGAASFLIDRNLADEAISLLNEHDELVKQVPAIEALRGLALATNGQSSQALAAFAAALHQAQEASQISQIAAQMVRAWGASGALERLRTLDTADAPTLKIQLASAQIEIHSGQTAQALQRLRDVESQLAQASTEIRIIGDQMLARVLHESGEYEAAHEVYQRLLTFLPEDPRVLNNLAFLLANDLGQPEQALPLAEKAAALAPAQAHILDTLGWTQYKAGQHEQARVTLEQALSINPLAVIYLHLGTLHKDLGDPSQALELLDEAIRLAERNDERSTLERATELRAQLQQ